MGGGKRRVKRKRGKIGGKEEDTEERKREGRKRE